MTGGRVTPAAIGLVTLLLVAACAPGVGPTGNPPTVAPESPPTEPAVGEVRVVLGLYSGRPDPEWTLSPAEVAVLDAAIAVLPDATGTPPTGGLGYHGFTVTRPGRSFTAYQGAVAAPGPDPRPFKRDAGRAIERHLLEAGRSHLTPDEIAAVEQALQQ